VVIDNELVQTIPATRSVGGLLNATADPWTGKFGFPVDFKNELQVAQINAYYHLNRQHEWLNKRGIKAKDMDHSVTVVTNINDYCNAYYQGNVVHFFKSGGTKKNGAPHRCVQRAHQRGVNCTIERPTPTIARVVPTKDASALEQLLGYEPFTNRRKACLLKLNTQTACPPPPSIGASARRVVALVLAPERTRRRIPVNQGRGFAVCFNSARPVPPLRKASAGQVAFDDGYDCSSYGGAKSIRFASCRNHTVEFPLAQFLCGLKTLLPGSEQSAEHVEIHSDAGQHGRGSQRAGAVSELEEIVAAETPHRAIFLHKRRGVLDAVAERFDPS